MANASPAWSKLGVEVSAQGLGQRLWFTSQVLNPPHTTEERELSSLNCMQISMQIFNNGFFFSGGITIQQSYSILAGGRKKTIEQ